MKPLNWCAFAVIIFSFTSCVQKHQCKSHLRIKTVYNALEGYTSSYAYSNDGLLTTITTSKGGKTTIQYSDGAVHGRMVDKDGRLLSRWICFLNKRGLVDSLVKSDSVQVVSTKRFVYDDKGFAVQERNYLPHGEYTITHKVINDGNVASFTVMHVGPYATRVNYNSKTHKNDTLSINAVEVEYEVYNDYFPDKVKTTSYENYGSAEFGEGAKNVERKTVQLSSQGDTLDVSYFRYEFDKMGRVGLCVTRNQSGDLTDSSYFTYY
ncbi:MAG TPA: hypothetical protein VG603_01220 [Chitinophagales bacterium]|nr:hypothetical protein [Chitinophagales bacterium]